MSSGERELHRLRNRDSMRTSRQRKHQEMQEMKNTVVHLEKRYATLHQLSCNMTQDTGDILHYDNVIPNRRYAAAFALSKRLGAENLLLQEVIKRMMQWELKIECILDFKATDIVCSQDLQTSTPSVDFDVMDKSLMGKELGFRRLSDCDFSRIIMENKRAIDHVETKVLQKVNETRSHRMQAFGWDIVQCIDGGVMEFVFTKRFFGLNIRKIMQTTWLNYMQLERFRKIMAETRRLQVIQQLSSNAMVFVRDVASPGDISLFRSVFALFLVETSRELQLHDKIEYVTGTGYSLGTQSVMVDETHRFSDAELSGKLVWADLALTIDAFDVNDAITGTTNQYVRWARRTNYCSEEHAQRNASDTVQAMLRWEMLVIEPVLNIV